MIERWHGLSAMAISKDRYAFGWAKKKHTENVIWCMRDSMTKWHVRLSSLSNVLPISKCVTRLNDSISILLAVVFKAATKVTHPISPVLMQINDEVKSSSATNCPFVLLHFTRISDCVYFRHWCILIYTNTHVAHHANQLQIRTNPSSRMYRHTLAFYTHIHIKLSSRFNNRNEFSLRKKKENLINYWCMKIKQYLGLCILLHENYGQEKSAR